MLISLIASYLIIRSPVFTRAECHNHIIISLGVTMIIRFLITLNRIEGNLIKRLVLEKKKFFRPVEMIFSAILRWKNLHESEFILPYRSSINNVSIVCTRRLSFTTVVDLLTITVASMIRLSMKGGHLRTRRPPAFNNQKIPEFSIQRM